MLKDEKALEQRSDEELMELYQKGTSQAFDVIYRRYVSRILSYMKKKAHSDKNAQDLSQEVFLKLHRSRDQYNKMLPLAPWIFSITRSVFLDFSKKNSMEDITNPDQFDELTSEDTSSHNGEQEPELLSILPELQKKAVSLRVFDKATFDEIADRLSTSPNNARQLFSRGIRKLKSNLGGRES